MKQEAERTNKRAVLQRAYSYTFVWGLTLATNEQVSDLSASKWYQQDQIYYTVNMHTHLRLILRRYMPAVML